MADNFEKLTGSVDLSLALWERALKVAPGGVHSPVRAFKNVSTHPRFIKEAKGATIIDVQGREWIDFCMSWGPLMFGHQDPDVASVVMEALKRGWTFGAAEPYSLDVAELMVAKIPFVEKVRFVSSGTEAVMSALRVARAATGKSKIIKFDGCYHGHVDSMLVRAGSGLAEMSEPDSAGLSLQVAGETLVSPLGDSQKVEEFLKSGEVAAIIIEPLPANFGLLPQKLSFLCDLRHLCSKYKALLIFDEVISGFRVDFGGMAALTGIDPDLVCYGKVIGGGFPVGAYAGRTDYMDLVAPQGPVYQAGTLSANPVAMVAGLCNLQKLYKENPYTLLSDRVETFSRNLENRLREKSKRFSLKVQNFASLFWLVIEEKSNIHDQNNWWKSKVTRPDKIPLVQKIGFSHLYPLLLNRGVYLAPSGFEVGFLSLAHTEKHLEKLSDALFEVWDEWERTMERLS